MAMVVTLWFTGVAVSRSLPSTMGAAQSTCTHERCSLVSKHVHDQMAGASEINGISKHDKRAPAAYTLTRSILIDNDASVYKDDHKQHDFGDALVIDNSEIPSIQPAVAPWRDADGSGKALRFLSPSDQNGLWAEALAKGTLIKQWLGESHSRLIVMSTSRFIMPLLTSTRPVRGSGTESPRRRVGSSTPR